MKPQRMRITHELVSAYGMLDKMHVLVSATLSPRERLLKGTASKTGLC